MKKRGEIQLTPEEQEKFLGEARKASLATIDKEGYPHVVAMNFIWRDGAILMSSYGKAQKVLNVRRNRKVGVMVEAGRAYAELRGVMIRGDCEIVEDFASVNAMMRAIRREAGDVGVGEEPIASAPKRVILKVVPKKIATWDHSKLGGKY
jgi:nitroimidazol reductase NimA-like FMN-containing flavoprotein (pyridoxamine 5'-phosphate oxidase superfamily)